MINLPVTHYLKNYNIHNCDIIVIKNCDVKCGTGVRGEGLLRDGGEEE